jgi:hypothetical protein
MHVSLKILAQTKKIRIPEGGTITYISDYTWLENIQKCMQVSRSCQSNPQKKINTWKPY